VRAEVEVRSSSGTSTPTTSYPAPPAHPHSTLKSHIRFYTDIMYIGADIPRLRPVELGQTEEDRQHYEEAFERRFPGRRRRAEE